jgi:seryl-tRNA synthetase
LLGAIDVERAAKVSGSRFYYLTGIGARLELALVNMAMDLALDAGFTPMVPPVLVKPSTMEGTGFLGQAAENVYRIELDDLYLVGTAEVPLAGYHSDEILDAAALPHRYVAMSSCFRREAGTYGKDTRGIIRVHQFDKVEMFAFVDAADAEAEHQRLLAWEKQFMDLLEIPYRVIDVATGDLGASASRKFDIEAWIPTQGKYREVTSTSNCTTFQSRRLNVRMRDTEGTRPVATLNGTLCAIPRIIVAILENHQQADGSVVLPAALRPYLRNLTHLTP